MKTDIIIGILAILCGLVTYANHQYIMAGINAFTLILCIADFIWEKNRAKSRTRNVT